MSEHSSSRQGQPEPIESNGNKGVLPGLEGVILQRGGEELKLKKIRDRLTLCLRTAKVLSRLVEQWTPQRSRNITPQGVQSPEDQAQEIVVEWQIQASRLDDVLAQLRTSEAVIYASHVYQLEASPGTYAYVANQLTVQFVPSLTVTKVDAIAHALGLIRTHALGDDSNTYCFKVGPTARQNPLKIANAIIRKPEVLMAEPNIIMAIAPLYRPEDDRYPDQWHLYHRGGPSLAANSHVFAEKAWDLTRGSRSVTIAITDDGFELQGDHRDRVGNHLQQDGFQAKPSGG